MHLTNEKNLLRSSIEERLKRLNDTQRAAESRSVCRRLLPEIPTGSIVCAYAALRTEPNMQMLLSELQERGDRVFLPVFHANRLTFREWKQGEPLTPGALRIPEPPEDNPLLPEGEATIVLVPGRAFDRTGCRLGRGNGGYDIWIAAERKNNPTVRCIGVAFECQIVTSVPTEPHDQRMDAVATARGTL